jgi:hypothetical protein
MMRRFLLVAAVLAALPATAAAQNFSIGARVGTLGLGPEVGLQLTNLIVLRGGAGFIPLSYTGELGGDGDLVFTLKPTSPIMNVGVDLSLGDFGLRLGGGMLLLPNATTFEGEYTGAVRIGGQEYQGSQIGTLLGELIHGSASPYANIGFGAMTGRGMNIFMDIGAAFMKDPTLTLTATGQAASDPNFQQSLERERASIEDQVQGKLRILPIVSLGFRYGL